MGSASAGVPDSRMAYGKLGALRLITGMHATDASPPQDGFARTPEGIAQFFEDNHHALVSYVYSWMRSRSDALDIVQEAYCRVMRLDNIASVGHLRGYLFKTAKNIATDWVRQRTVRDAYVQEEPLRGDSQSASPEEIWLAREELDEVARDIEMLPHKCRVALTMIRLEGGSYEDVATHFNIKIHSARRLVERAMEKLNEEQIA